MIKRTIPETLQLDQITALVDTREQRPLDLTPMKTERCSLSTADYSVHGLEQYIAIERKSLPDLLMCSGRERARFDRVVKRLLAYPVRAIVVEATWSQIEEGNWQSQLKPEQVLGSLTGWIANGVPIVMAGDRDGAANHVRRLIYIAVKRRYRECRELLKSTLC